MSEKLKQKRIRAEHANDLIKTIASHGRKFFLHANSGRLAKFEVDNRGRVWFIDLMPYCISCKIELRGGNIDDLKQNISLIHSSKVIIDDENTKIIYQIMLDCAKNEVPVPD